MNKYRLIKYSPKAVILKADGEEIYIGKSHWFKLHEAMNQARCGLSGTINVKSDDDALTGNLITLKEKIETIQEYIIESEMGNRNNMDRYYSCFVSLGDLIEKIDDYLEE